MPSLPASYFLVLFLAFFLQGCHATQASTQEIKQAIIQTLENETMHFCERDLAKWQEHWSHQPFVSKMYAGDTDFMLFDNWEEINQNTLNHIEQFPEAIPIPVTDHVYTIELFKDTAIVRYSKEWKGKKVKEFRFMVKEGNNWKIAIMETIF
jgi:hypothetical protein